MDHHRAQGPPLVTLVFALLGMMPTDILDLGLRVLAIAIGLVGAFVSIRRYQWDSQDRSRKS